MAKTQIRLQAVTGSLAASGDSRDYAIKANTDGALPAAAAAEAIDVGDLAGILQQYGNAISRISGKGDWFSQAAGQFTHNLDIRNASAPQITLRNLDTSVNTGDDIGLIKWTTADSEAGAAADFAQLYVEQVSNAIGSVGDAKAEMSIKLASGAAAAEKLRLTHDGTLKIDKLQELTSTGDISVKGDTLLRMYDSDDSHYAAWDYSANTTKSVILKLPADSSTASANQLLGISSTDSGDPLTTVQLDWITAADPVQKKFLTISASNDVRAGVEFDLDGATGYNLALTPDIAAGSMVSGNSEQQRLDIYVNGQYLQPSNTSHARGTLDIRCPDQDATVAIGGTAQNRDGDVYPVVPGSHIKVTLYDENKTFCFVDRYSSILAGAAGRTGAGFTDAEGTTGNLDAASGIDAAQDRVIVPNTFWAAVRVGDTLLAEQVASGMPGGLVNGTLYRIRSKPATDRIQLCEIDDQDEAVITLSAGTGGHTFKLTSYAIHTGDVLAVGDCIAGAYGTSANPQTLANQRSANDGAERYKLISGATDVSSHDAKKLSVVHNDIIGAIAVDVCNAQDITLASNTITQKNAWDALAVALGKTGLWAGTADKTFHSAATAIDGNRADCTITAGRYKVATASDLTFTSQRNLQGVAPDNGAITSFANPISLRDANANSDVALTGGTFGPVVAGGVALNGDYGVGGSGNSYIVFAFDLEIDDTLCVVYRQ
tara:strand:+ start:1509 stop:3653 length:2145 start_codon:yes stop_codon:yes gene_type:complete